MTVTPASQKALEAHSRQRRNDADTRIDKAFKRMRKRGVSINVSSLAREAGVSRSVIHRRPDIREQIRNCQPLAAVPDAPLPSAADSDNSIIAALRTRLKTRDAQIAELKAQLRERDHIIATLHGELARNPRT